jgi:hypothetical protein
MALSRPERVTLEDLNGFLIVPPDGRSKCAGSSFASDPGSSALLFTGITQSLKVSSPLLIGFTINVHILDKE